MFLASRHQCEALEGREVKFERYIDMNFWVDPEETLRLVLVLFENIEENLCRLMAFIFAAIEAQSMPTTNVIPLFP